MNTVKPKLNSSTPVTSPPTRLDEHIEALDALFQSVTRCRKLGDFRDMTGFLKAISILSSAMVQQYEREFNTQNAVTSQPETPAETHPRDANVCLNHNAPPAHDNPEANEVSTSATKKTPGRATRRIGSSGHSVADNR